MKALVIGNGSSKTNIDFIKNFVGVIISCDKVARNMVQNDIIPNYITFCEIKEGIENTVIEYLPDYFSNFNTTVVYRTNEIPLIQERSESLKLNTLVFHTPSYVNNVGLYSIIFAIEHLGIKELHLIGLEHKGKDHPPAVFENWVSRFKKYLNKKKPDCNIIDHSNGRLGDYLTT